MPSKNAPISQQDKAGGKPRRGRPPGAKDKQQRLRRKETMPRAKHLPGDPLYTGKSPFANVPLRRGRKNTKIGRDRLTEIVAAAFLWQEHLFSRALPEGRAGLARILITLSHAQQINHGKPAEIATWRYLYNPRNPKNAALGYALRHAWVRKYIERVSLGRYMLNPQGQAYVRQANALINLFADTMLAALHQQPEGASMGAHLLAESAEFVRMNDPKNARIVRAALAKMQG